MPGMFGMNELTAVLSLDLKASIASLKKRMHPQLRHLRILRSERVPELRKSRSVSLALTSLTIPLIDACFALRIACTAPGPLQR